MLAYGEFGCPLWSQGWEFAFVWNSSRIEIIFYGTLFCLKLTHTDSLTNLSASLFWYVYLKFGRQLWVLAFFVYLNRVYIYIWVLKYTLAYDEFGCHKLGIGICMKLFHFVYTYIIYIVSSVKDYSCNPHNKKVMLVWKCHL